ncbi:MAG: hypothetical protein SH868_09735, partial [Bythopirellula sp.]|nr:hypothetical protein [Bythopirellula sp.]
MYFPESEAIANDHQGLRGVVEQIDLQLATIFAPAPLRAMDISCAIGCDTNQVASVFELLAVRGVLRSEAMVECEKCQNLMPAVKFHEAFEDEDEFACTSCGRLFRGREQPLVIYRMTSETLRRPRPTLPEAETPLTNSEEPLGDRAQVVLIAMLEMGAIDSDARRTTEEIAIKAFSNKADANSLK